ncbi:MAG: D-sedoheptulose 7-phosphate isomerase [candidate division WOR-3 bacterium]
MNTLIKAQINESINLKKALLRDEFIDTIITVGKVVANAYKNNKKVILFGNGGSAADAQHIAAELVGKYRLVRSGLPALALTTNTSIITAIGNDFSFDDVFSHQIETFGEEGDIAIGITTSGKSKNVINGLKKARKRRLTTIVLTGKDGMQLKKITDYCICVPSVDTPRIQEIHITIGHIICEIVERLLFR